MGKIFDKRELAHPHAADVGQIDGRDAVGRENAATVGGIDHHRRAAEVAEIYVQGGTGRGTECRTGGLQGGTRHAIVHAKFRPVAHRQQAASGGASGNVNIHFATGHHIGAGIGINPQELGDAGTGINQAQRAATAILDRTVKSGRTIKTQDGRAGGRIVNRREILFFVVHVIDRRVVAIQVQLAGIQAQGAIGITARQGIGRT